MNKPEGQLVFLDTPGIHDSLAAPQPAPAEIARDALGEADIVL